MTPSVRLSVHFHKNMIMAILGDEIMNTCWFPTVVVCSLVDWLSSWTLDGLSFLYLFACLIAVSTFRFSLEPELWDPPLSQGPGVNIPLESTGDAKPSIAVHHRF